MLHGKYQDHRTSSSGEDSLRYLHNIYENGGYFGHVTWTIYINFFPPPREPPNKIWL